MRARRPYWNIGAVVALVSILSLTGELRTGGAVTFLGLVLIIGVAREMWIARREASHRGES
jgi:hypothetical protein